MQDIKPGANSVHKAPQKSKTLNRKFTKKPVKSPDNQIKVNQTNKKTTTRTARSTGISQSDKVSRFAKKPLLKKTDTSISPLNSSSPLKNPKKYSSVNTKTTPEAKLSAKEKEIQKALGTNSTNKVKTPPKNQKNKNKKRFIIYTAIFASFLALLSGVLYFSIPALSIHFASNQAGINARYPREYPEGFTIAGTASYQNGSVVIPFKSHDHNHSFVITQTKTIWDSTKLKSEVKKLSNDNFATTEYKGLTIFHYTLRDQYITTWINGDILYVISGNANLDPSQIRATIDGLS